ncbi:hypothetical protein BXZ70DRAFT_229611 [Cristinia sonorae]|uniref:Uncharacterized protein n=1 Tax=Cristinia sonorae TaxID=1940300 RepID=A0A8K0ULF7_9AGAR|nr:hypothetical protein BXZ70DRAFT_229611 [Cristinia sonorae]
MSDSVSPPTSIAAGRRNRRNQQSREANAEKQKPCNLWTKSGACRFGDACKFEHDVAKRAAAAITGALVTGIQEQDMRATSTRFENTGQPYNPDCDVDLGYWSVPIVVKTGTNVNIGVVRPSSSKNRRGATALDDTSIQRDEPAVLNSRIGICWKWKAGKCSRGEACKYRHDGEARSVRNETTQNARTTTSSPVASVQNNGTTARVLLPRQSAQVGPSLEEQAQRAREILLRRQRHQREEVERAQAQARQAEIARQQEEARQRELRLEEMAREQEAARRRAEEERVEQERRERARVARQAQEARWREESRFTEQYVVMDHSLITCGAGLDIQHVVTGFSLCRITVKNLPRNATRNEIADIFIQQGVTIADIFIPHDGIKDVGGKRQAVVLVQAEQGQIIAAGLEGIEFRDDTLSFEVSDNASWNAMGASKMTQPFLEVNWMLPTEVIIASYATPEEARQHAQSLNGLIWEGHRLKASLDNHRFAGPATTCVKLLHCPAGSSYDEAFTERTGAFHHRILHGAKYTKGYAETTVHMHITELEGVRMETYQEIPAREGYGMAKIKVFFDDWDHLKAAFDSLHDKTLGGCLKTRAWHPAPHCYEIMIPIHQYRAQKKQWDALAERKPGRDAYLQVRIGDRGDAFVRVRGDDKKAAGALKVRVEGMVAGERLDPTFWHASFLSDRAARAFFDRIRASTGVFVRIDSKTHSLRVYGDDDGVKEVRGMIKAEVDRLAGMETNRVLDFVSIAYFLREGLGKLKELLGEENAVLHVASRPPRIVIKGGEEARHHLQRLIDESRTYIPLAAPRNGEEEGPTCPVCYTEASNPEELGCGHTYCAGCLRHFLSTAAESKEFPLVCMGNNATCNCPISIPFIRRFMHPQAFANLVESAFSSYLDQHSQELKYCKTPDCTQIYRRQTGASILQCPSCSATVCPGCDEEAHEGMTCTERQLHSDPAYQQRRETEELEAAGCKRCPSCRAWIQKNDGCNHMTCRSCQTHFCWICLGVFGDREVYQHMNAVHGGIFDANAAPVVDAGNVPAPVFAQQQQEILADIERRRLAQQLRQPRAVPLVAGYGQDRDAADAAQRRYFLDGAILNRPGTNQPVAGPGPAAQALRLAREREREQERAREAQALRLAREQEREQERARVAHARWLQAENARVRRERAERENNRGWCVVM